VSGGFLGGGGSTATTAGPWSFTPETYGAKGDLATIYDVSITSGLKVATSPSNPWKAADVGKHVLLTGAGLGSPARGLHSTIASYQGPGQVTLADASNATLTGVPMAWGTDDTAAIAAAVAAAKNYATSTRTNYGQVTFRAVGYMLAAATTKGGTTAGNAQVPIPPVDPTTGSKVILSLQGAAGSGGQFAHFASTVPQVSGTVLFSALVEQAVDGTWSVPSVIGGPTVYAPGSGFANLLLHVDNLQVMTDWNPSLSGMFLRHLAQVKVGTYGFLAFAGVAGTGADLRTIPTNSNCIGLDMPANQNNALSEIGCYQSEGAYYSLAGGEHLHAARHGAIYGAVALFITVGGLPPQHGIRIDTACYEVISTQIQCAGSAGGVMPITIGLLDAENPGATTVIDDPQNCLRGEINYLDIYHQNALTVNGAANVSINNLWQTRGVQTPPSVPATTVALVNPFWHDAAVTITGGTVTVIAVDGTATGLTAGTVIVPTGKAITLTYSVAPSWVWSLI
jgi:hypothetical protein